MKKGTKKKGVHPAVAVLFLCVSAGVAVRQFWSGGSVPTPSSGPVEDAMPAGSTETVAVEATSCGDLLLAHGSFDDTKPIRVAFSGLPQAAPVAAAPGGETKPAELESWTGEDPPVLQLGVVMVSEASRRAVLGGRVVGIGDQVAESEVMSIERGSVVVRWNGRLLTYELDERYPREFRSELARRKAQTESAPDTEHLANQEEGK